MNNELMDVSKQVEVWNEYKKIAQEMIKSGFLPPALNTPEKVITVVMVGRELKVPMMEAMRGINVIAGKPSLSPQLMLAMINRSEQLEDIEINSHPTYCDVTMTRKDRKPHTATFGDKEAKAMFLSGKDNYRKQAQTMYKWRAISACARVVFPDVIGGLYTPEEVQSHTDVEETIGSIATQKQIAENPEEYTKFKDELFAQFAAEKFEKPFDVVKWQKAHKADISRLLEEDRVSIESVIENTHSALITGEKPPKINGSQTLLDHYRAEGDKCKTVEELIKWFNSINGEASNKMSKTVYGQFIDYLKEKRTELENKKENTPEQTSELVAMSDYLKESIDSKALQARLTELKPQIDKLDDQNKQWIENEIATVRDRLTPKKYPKKKKDK